jgi:transposase
MAKSYLPTERDQPFLLPPDMREWLPEKHLVWLVLEVVREMDTTELHARHRNDGPGRKAYDPDMLLGLLVYAYCRGIRSSREIEGLCEVDVAFRVLSANHFPDHSTISRFRQSSVGVMERLFCQVLELCWRAGMVSVGVVAVDGTKIEAAARMGANRSRADLEALARKILEEAAEVDRREDELYGESRGDELPPELYDPDRRSEVIRRALEELNSRQGEIAKEEQGRVERAAEAVAREEQRAAEKASRRAALEAKAAVRGRKVNGRKPHPGGPDRLRRARRVLEKAVAASATRVAERGAALKTNLTDPDSRIMKTKDRFIQGYNAQAAATEAGVVIACGVTKDRDDHHQAQEMMRRVEKKSALIGQPVGTLLFDAGYLSDDNLTAPGPDRLIATTSGRKLRQWVEAEGHRQGAPPPGASPTQVMEHRLLTEEGAALYRKRGSSIEAVFGNIKQKGYRRFVRRGLAAVSSEWQLICATHNLLKLHRVTA